MRRLILIAIGVVALVLMVAAGSLYWVLSDDGIRRSLESQASSWLGQPVTIGAARASVFPRLAIHLTEVSAGQPAQVTIGSVDVSTDLWALIRQRRIEDAAVVISDSRIQLPLTFASTTRPGSTPDAGAGASASSVDVASIRSIALRDVELVSRGKTVTVSAESALDGNRLRLTQFTASSGKTSLQATGTIDVAPRFDATLDVDANQLDVDELLALAAAFTPPDGSPATRSSTPNNARLSARVNAVKGTAGGVAVERFAATLQMEGDKVALSGLTFQLFGGRFDGEVNATLGAQLGATLYARLQGLDVAQVAAFGGSPDTITGRLSGNATVSGRGTDFGGVLASARGSGSASILDGTIKRLNLVRTIVLFFGRPAADAPDGTDNFRRMDAMFSLGGGVFRADGFSMTSEDVDLQGSAVLDTTSQRLDGRINLRLSETLSAQAGTDLARYTREGNRVVLPGRITGTLREPRVTIDARAAISRGIRNEVGRRLGDFLRRPDGR